MNIEFEGNPITIERVQDIALHIRRQTPKVDWGDGELRNAVFETLAKNFGLPNDPDIGCPDWNNEGVQQLSKKLLELYRYEDGFETISNIQAVCLTTGCDFTTSGTAKIDKVSKILTECELTQSLRQHHISSGNMNHHNRFSLTDNNSQTGIASVSSQVCTGFLGYK